MLKLVLGIAGSGKTTCVMQEIARRAEAGQASILLVPEQFSSSAESMAYQALGDARSVYVEVLSFRTVAERVLKACGGLSLPQLSEAGRMVYVRRALGTVGQHLRSFARQRRSAAFCSLCAHTLQELKTAGATPALLRQVAGQEDDAKLEEIALIYEAYEAEIAGSAVDPEDRLSLAAEQAGCGYLTDKACFVDSFDGFTAPEYAMLRQLLQHGESLTVALCCPGLGQAVPVPDLFTPVRATARHLMRLAQKAERPVAAPQVLPVPQRHKKDSLTALNLLLAGQEEAAETAADGGVWLAQPADEWEELRDVAAQMHALALEGVPYSRMAVICRDMAAYESVARRQLALYDIPLFMDSAGTIEYAAPVAFVRAALGLMQQGLGSRGVLALLKTGLCGVADEDIAALENYVYTWEPRAAQWRAPFENNPEGLLAELTDTAAQQLQAAEAVRAAVVPHIDAFVQGARDKNAAGLSRAIYLLMDRFGAPEHATARAAQMEEAGEVLWAEESRRAWDMAMDLLDEMARLVGGEYLSAAEYDELFLILVRGTDFALAPQTLECAVLTSADRMRLDAPTHCFVVGCNEGDFPMQVGYSGLLTHHDRERLVAGGVEMPGSFENRVMLEDMFFYRALAAASDAVYISAPRRRAGQAKTPSAALAPVQSGLCPPAPRMAAEMLAATPAAAYSLLGQQYRDNTPLAATLYATLQAPATGWQPQALELLRRVDNPGHFTVGDAAALQRLVGQEMNLSATMVERYYKCRFSYYLERVLRVKPRSRAVVSPMESGTFVHHVLEMVLREAGAGFAACSDAELEDMAHRHAEAFIKENLPVDTARARWQLAQIQQATARLLCYMRDAAAASDFEIDALELEIGGEEVPALELETAAGHRVRLRGKIDRVDVLRQNGKTHLCIIDYKTGGKKFSLDDVYYGANMQMMIYMAALCKNAGMCYENPVPAGVLYLSSDPAPETGSREGETRPVYKMDGLLVKDTELLHAMDRQGEGIFIPVKFNRDGSPRAGGAVAEMEKFGAVLAHVEGLLGEMAGQVQAGSFDARPLVSAGQSPCAWCPYRAACRHEDGVNETEARAPEGVFEGGGADG